MVPVEIGIPPKPVVLFDMGYRGWLVASGNAAPVPVPVVTGIVPLLPVVLFDIGNGGILVD